MGQQLHRKVIPQIFFHQDNTEKHLTQSIKQCGEEEYKEILYIIFFRMYHNSKIEFSLET